VAKRLSISLNLVLATVLAWVLLGSPGASGAAGTKFVNLAAPAFTPLNYSTHNDGLDTCGGAYVPQPPHTNGDADVNGENRGQLDNAKGSFVHDFNLPQAARIRSFALFVNDADTDTNVFALLVRRQIAPNPFPKGQGYTVMARVHSTGSVTDKIRKFSTTKVGGAVIDNARFMYFVEMVDCGIPEPFAARVGFTT